MNHKYLYPVISCLSVSMSTPAITAESNGKPQESVGQFLIRSEEEKADAFVEYCGAAVPSLKESLEAANLEFKRKFRAATLGYMEDRLAEPAFIKRAPADLVSAFSRGSERTLNQIRQQNPQKYCPWLKANIESATEESIRNNVRNSFVRYEALQIDGSTSRK